MAPLIVVAQGPRNNRADARSSPHNTRHMGRPEDFLYRVSAPQFLTHLLRNEITADSSADIATRLQWGLSPAVLLLAAVQGTRRRCEGRAFGLPRMRGKSAWCRVSVARPDRRATLFDR